MDHSTQIAPAGSTRSLVRHTNAFLRALLDNLHHHRLIIAMMVLYGLSGIAYTKIFHLEAHSRFTLFGITGFYLLLLTIVSFFIIYCLRLQITDRPRQLLPYAIGKLRNEFLTYDRIISATVAIVCLYFMLAVFTNFKRMIPLVVPFYLDQSLHELDQFIHFGMEPWRILQPILGTPLITFIINVFYNIWLFIFIMVFYWQAFCTKDRQLRLQYMTSFMVCWLLIGTVAATMMSSAGPCFWSGVVPGDNPYAPLMDYLYKANETYPIWALEMQEILLYNYQKGQLALVAGITAMPSMHVSLSTLMALLGWRVSRPAGWFFTTYCGIIMVGSVHLGWHYAIDGYVSLIATLIIWYACGWITRRMIRKDDERLPETI